MSMESPSASEDGPLPPSADPMEIEEEETPKRVKVKPQDKWKAVLKRHKPGSMDPFFYNILMDGVETLPPCVRVHAPNPDVKLFDSKLGNNKREAAVRDACNQYDENAARIWHVAVYGQMGHSKPPRWMTGVSVAPTPDKCTQPEYFRPILGEKTLALLQATKLRKDKTLGQSLQLRPERQFEPSGTIQLPVPTAHPTTPPACFVSMEDAFYRVMCYVKKVYQESRDSSSSPTTAPKKKKKQEEEEENVTTTTPAKANKREGKNKKKKKNESLANLSVLWAERKATALRVLKWAQAEDYFSKTSPPIEPTMENKKRSGFFHANFQLDIDVLAAFVKQLDAKDEKGLVDSLSLIGMCLLVQQPTDLWVHTFLQWQEKSGAEVNSMTVDNVALLLRNNKEEVRRDQAEHVAQLVDVNQKICLLATKYPEVLDRMRVLLAYAQCAPKIYSILCQKGMSNPPMRCALTGKLIPAGNEQEWYALDGPNPLDPDLGQVRLAIQRWLQPASLFYKPPTSMLEEVPPPPPPQEAPLLGEPPTKKAKLNQSTPKKKNNKDKGKEKETPTAAPQQQQTDPMLSVTEKQPFTGLLPPALNLAPNVTLQGTQLFLNLVKAAFSKPPEPVLEGYMRQFLSTENNKVSIKTAMDQLQKASGVDTTKNDLSNFWPYVIMAMLSKFLGTDKKPEEGGGGIVPLVITDKDAPSHYYRAVPTLLGRGQALGGKAEQFSVSTLKPFHTTQLAAARVLFGPLRHLQ